MATYIQDQIFRSRLTIRYRTSIEGAIRQEPLPFRVLVLGDFSGKRVRDDELLPDLEQRQVKSIVHGMRVDQFLSEQTPFYSLPATGKHLRSQVPGTVKGAKVEAVIAAETMAKDTAAPVSIRVKGSAVFESPATENRVCDMRGVVRLLGTVPVSVKSGTATVAGDVELTVAGAAEGVYVDEVTNKVIGKVSAYLSSVPLKVVQASTKIDFDDPTETGLPFTVTFGDQPIVAARTIPIHALKAFGPDAVTANVPELFRLQVVKLLLQELQADLKNLPELRKAMKTVLASPDGLSKLSALRAWAIEQFPLLRLEPSAPAPAQVQPAQPPAPAPAPAPQATP